MTRLENEAVPAYRSIWPTLALSGLTPFLHFPRVETLYIVSVVCWPEGSAPKGQESLAQGSPWVSQIKCFALKLKGLKMRPRSDLKVRSRFTPYLVAPSGLIRFGELPRVNPGLNPGLYPGLNPGLCFHDPSGRRTLNTYETLGLNCTAWD
jgi:hypothetical protein